MKKGDIVYTPRFCAVEIEGVYENRADAAKDGYTEPTYYEGDSAYGIAGKPLNVYNMTFAAYLK